MYIDKDPSFCWMMRQVRTIPTLGFNASSHAHGQVGDAVQLSALGVVAVPVRGHGRKSWRFPWESRGEDPDEWRLQWENHGNYAPKWALRIKT